MKCPLTLSPEFKNAVIKARNESEFDDLNVYDFYIYGFYITGISMAIVLKQAELCNGVT
jgi:hypothetical protein